MDVARFDHICTNLVSVIYVYIKKKSVSEYALFVMILWAFSKKKLSLVLILGTSATEFGIGKYD